MNQKMTGGLKSSASAQFGAGPSRVLTRAIHIDTTKERRKAAMRIPSWAAKIARKEILTLIMNYPHFDKLSVKGLKCRIHDAGFKIHDLGWQGGSEWKESVKLEIASG